MPSTKEITDAVLNGQNIRKAGDGHYFIYAGQPATPVEAEDIAKSTRFANLVHSYVKRYYEHRATQPTNYESMAYVLTQIAETISGEFDNPAVQPLVEHLERSSEVAEIIEGSDLLTVAENTANYIVDIAWSLLKREPTETNYLNFILAVREDSKNGLYVFTLNHDLVLDCFLKSQKVTYADGFGGPKGPVRLWENALRPDGESKIVVAKLHGSIDWFVYNTTSGQMPVIPLGDPYHLGGPKDQLPQDLPVFPRPMLLIGTFNKIYSYNSGIFADLHCCFHQVLRETSTLVTVGYGFGDKGINTKLVQWLNGSSSRRLLVAHPNPDELRCCARGAISKQWDGWKKEGKLVEVPKKAEEISWESDLRCFVIS